MHPQVLNFIKETFNRLLGKSSKYFYIWQITLSVMFLLGRLPWALERWTTIVASEQFINFCKDISTLAAGAIMSMFLTSDSSSQAVTTNGEIVNKVQKEKFPFTTEITKKKFERGEVPIIPEEHVNI